MNYVEKLDQIVGKSTPYYRDLTTREKEVLNLLLRGYNQKEIAELLFIGYNTVNTHKRNIYDKLGLSKMKRDRQVKLQGWFIQQILEGESA